MKKKVCALLAAGMCCAASFGTPEFAVPVARELPAVDGVIGPREYDEGVRFAGFLRASPEALLVPGGEGFATFLTDGATLYAAWRVKARNIDIGGGLRAAATDRDGAVWDDDEVELAVEGDNPDRIAHFIFNPVGTAYDSLSARNGKADVTWNCPGLKVASVVKQGWWEIEAAVPLASIGPTENGLLVNAARVGPGDGPSSLNASHAHIQGPKIRLVWREGAAAIQMDAIGVPAEGRWQPSLAVTKAPEGTAVRADVFLREIVGDGGREGPVHVAESRVLKAGERLGVAFNTRSRSEFRLEVTARDADTGRLLFSRELYARRGARTEGVPATGEFDLEGAAEVVAYHYPGMNRVRFNVFPLPETEAEAGTCSLNGKTAALEKRAGYFTVLAEAPSAEGKHPVSFAVTSAAGVKTFPDAWALEKKRFEWEGNQIGREKIILPPFIPIRGSGDTLGVLLREYRFGAAGLPASVKALGRELLAAPAYFEAVVDGKRVRFTGTSPDIAVTGGGYEASLAASARAEGVNLAVNGTLEYDGFIWNELSLSGTEGKTLDRFTLVVPLKDAEAPLMHICTADSIRYNPTGKVPAGEGVVWDGTKLHRSTGFLDDMFAPQTVPYVWLGAEKRGLSWFINNTCGMRLDPAKPSVRIVRENGVLRMEADFVNVPSRLKNGPAFAFGFEATPVKTADHTMRRHFQTGPGHFPENMIPRQGVSFHAGGFWNGWARIPYGGDWTLFELACRRVNTGGVSNEYAAAYAATTGLYDHVYERYASDLPDIGKQTHWDWIKSCRDYAYKTVLKNSVPAYPFKYSDPTLTWVKEEAVIAYASEWVSRSTGYIGATRTFPTPSYIDYILYYHKKETDCGIKGIYFDDMFPVTCRNPDTSCRTDGEGRVHGNFGILEMRELVKRASVMQHLAGVEPRLLQIHMTNCLLVPCFAFGTSMLSWEDHFGEELFQKRFNVDYVRAESLGSQVGAEAVALDGIQRRAYDAKEWRERRFAFLTRTQQAILLPAGVKLWLRPAVPFAGVDRKELFNMLNVLGRFETWADDCAFTPFYENDGAIAGEPADVLVGSYRRKGKVLALFGNQGGQDLAFPIKADAAKLGLVEPLEFVNGETGEKLPNGVLKLPAYDVRLILVTGKEVP